MKLDTVLVTAYATAPQGTAFYKQFEYMGVVLEVNLETDKIVNCSVTLITDTAKSFVSRLIIGEKLSENIDALLEDVDNHYLTVTANALKTALKKAQQRYLDHKRQLNN